MLNLHTSCQSGLPTTLIVKIFVELVGKGCHNALHGKSITKKYKVLHYFFCSLLLLEFLIFLREHPKLAELELALLHECMCVCLGSGPVPLCLRRQGAALTL